MHFGCERRRFNNFNGHDDLVAVTALTITVGEAPGMVAPIWKPYFRLLLLNSHGGPEQGI